MPNADETLTTLGESDNWRRGRRYSNVVLAP
jgi:hypothetical protein